MPQLDQNPQAGMVPSGSRVIIVVSSGPSAERPARYTEVPNVAGFVQGAALAQLQGSELHARVVNDYTESYKRGRVMGQLPNAGASVATGSDVVLLVSSGSAAHYGSPVMLPDVVGMSETDAVSELQAARLSPQLVRESSPTVPTGIVMSQLPNEAWLTAAPAKKQKWWIWIVAGLAALAVGLVAAFFLIPTSVQVPDVVGLSQVDAVKAIEAADLKVGNVTQRASVDVKEGQVAAQGPKAEALVRGGSEVDLIMSSGKPLIALPDVVGMTQDEAITQLRAMGLNTRTSTETTQGVEADTVLDQSPSAGEEVPVGTTVGLVVAEAPEKPQLTKVPDVSGFTRTDAEATLTEMGLKVVVVENASEKVADGVVITQLPEAGREVDPGTSVALSVSTGAPTGVLTVTVPSLVGQTLANGQAALTGLGLLSQPIALEGTEKAPTEIVGQAPAANAAVPPNSVILLLYAK